MLVAPSRFATFPQILTLAVKLLNLLISNSKYLARVSVSRGERWWLLYWASDSWSWLLYWASGAQLLSVEHLVPLVTNPPLGAGAPHRRPARRLNIPALYCRLSADCKLREMYRWRALSSSPVPSSTSPSSHPLIRRLSAGKLSQVSDVSCLQSRSPFQFYLQAPLSPLQPHLCVSFPRSQMHIFIH